MESGKGKYFLSTTYATGYICVNSDQIVFSCDPIYHEYNGKSWSDVLNELRKKKHLISITQLK